MKMHFIVYFIGILFVLTKVKCNVDHVGKNNINSSGNDDQDDDGTLNGINVNIEEREINEGLPSSWKLRKNKCGKTKIACKEAGGKCQAKGDDCDGELLQGKKYCAKNKKCGCCVPEDTCTYNQTRGICAHNRPQGYTYRGRQECGKAPRSIGGYCFTGGCGEPKQACKKLGGSCQKLSENACGEDNNMLIGATYCDNPRECGCCFPKDTLCDPAQIFEEKHVCKDCPESMTPLDFTKVRRGEPTLIVPANTVFASNDIKYVYGVREFLDSGKKRHELTCDMVNYVPTYYCCRTVLGMWKDCTGPEYCKVNTGDKTGHFLDYTFKCQIIVKTF